MDGLLKEYFAEFYRQHTELTPEIVEQQNSKSELQEQLTELMQKRSFLSGQGIEQQINQSAQFVSDTR